MSNIGRLNRARAFLTSERVSTLMRKRGVSALALANSVRIQRSTLDNYCAGRPIPSELLAGMARTLETSVAYLTAISNDPDLAPAVQKA